MRVYRIAKRQLIRDLSGDGARRFGGRWNRRGTGVLYTSESRSLATVEYLVHLSLNILPHDLGIAELEYPDTEPWENIDVSTLPSQWARYPAPPELAQIGSAWWQRVETLGLRVPSSVVKGEWNLVLNPLHPGFSAVKILSVEDYAFDQRLLGRRTER